MAMGGYLVWVSRKVLLDLTPSSKMGAMMGCHMSIGLICWAGEMSLCLEEEQSSNSVLVLARQVYLFAATRRAHG